MSIKKAKTLFAERISRVRKDAHLKQNEFAKRIGITQAYVSELELGKKEPSEQLLLSISRTFHVKMDWLKAGKGEVYEKTYTYDVNNPMIQAIIRQLINPGMRFPLGDIAMAVGIDRSDPNKIWEQPDDYWLIITWINKWFYEKDERAIKALMALIDALKPTEAELIKKIQAQFKSEFSKKG